MGRPKLTLPVGNTTVLGLVIAALHEAEVRPVVVVTGPSMPELEVLAKQAGAEVCRMAMDSPEMRVTVEYGLRWIESRFQPREDAAWLLVPGDYANLDAEIVRKLLLCRETHPEFTIWIPTHHGRRGHPALISWKHAAALQKSPPDQGINVYLREHASETFELATDTSAVVSDLDTPEDYDRLLSRRGEAAR
jgi:molybdenum cofactor cytidylyltransferase